MALNSILDPLLRPLLNVSPFLVILVVSIVLSVVTTIIYKYATDQTRLRKLKADLKRHQKKAMNAKDDPSTAMRHQKEIMKLNGEYFRASMKSMLYTFLPIIIFFGWLSANVAFAPLLPGTSFGLDVAMQKDVAGEVTLLLPDNLTTTDNLTKSVALEERKVSWTGLQGPKGTYDVSVRHEPSGEEQFIEVLITDEQKYTGPLFDISSSTAFKSATTSNEKLRIMHGIPVFEHIPVVKNFNWFWTYFLFTMIFSTTLRKALKIA